MKKILYSVMAMAALTFLFTSLTSCEDVPAPYEIPGEPGDDNSNGTLPYTSASLSDWNAVTVKGAAWSLGSTYAKASGYNGTSYDETEAWLVSPKFNTGSATGAVINFDHVIRYVFNESDLNNHELYISSDYAGDVKTATWTKLGYKPVASTTNTWDFYAANTISVPAEYLGKDAVVAFKFVSGSSNSTTWEIKNFSITEGTGGDEPSEPDQPAVGDNDGTEAKPFTATEALAKGSAKNVFVKAYIVGCIKEGAKDLGSAVFNASESPSQTNVLIAASADETNVEKCLPVQLPAGEVRTNLNLKDNASNLKEEVLMCGNIEKYFGVTGIKSVAYAKIGDKEFGKKPSGGGTDTPSGSEILNETFANGLGSFTVKDVKLTDGLTFVWKHDATYKYMKASAYVGGVNKACESWLVSSKLDMSKVSNATLSFEQALNYLKGQNRADYVKVLASTDYNGDVTKAAWTELSVEGWPATDSWTFGASTASMKAFAGKSNVYIAFKYTSNTSYAPIWEVKNVVVK